ncbi:MAG TPA: beta-ketoacyl synthase N-terminal-like domain-containing protein [Polyangiaceae bacterium]|nr:beta-ketoacyl synthase N-terminal-like domain-containing protein [Polyangiaceae bacterium]
MSGATILAVGAVSALGVGDAAFGVGALGERARVAIGHDETLARAGFARPIAARVSAVSSRAGDRATDLLRAALEQCLSRLGEVRPRWRESRVGLALGTSSGGMLTAETFFAARAGGKPVSESLARGATYFAPLEAASSDLGVDFSPRVLVLGACASSTLAVGLALRWLELGRCEIALAGGFDAVSEFVAAGFEALRATTATRPRPFRVGRDGMALGEGAGVVALELAPALARDEAETNRAAFAYVAGFGASTDAVHITAPDKMGQGLARAATLALADAGVARSRVDVVGAHATATPFNDAAEAKSMRIALGEDAPRLVHPFKAQIGHTLGAAGILESLALLDAMRRGIAPASAGEGELDPECAVRLADTNTPQQSTVSLKLSSAFGGANAALVFAPHVSSGRRAHGRTVFLHGFLSVTETFDPRTLAERMGARHPNLPRLDRLARLVLTAVHELSATTGPAAWEGGGVIVGHGLATLEQNELFDGRRRERGPRAVEPRRFPATSPNAAVGECAIAFRLTGPSFAVGGSLHGGLEALAVARDLVAAGDAATMLVVAADVAGPASSELLSAAGAPALPEGACVALLGALPSPQRSATGGRNIEVPADVPRALGADSDWIWSGPGGHLELEQYLQALGTTA